MPQHKWLLGDINSSSRVYVVGIMKAGKSTFINMMLNKLLDPESRKELNDKNKILNVEPGECTYFETEITIEYAEEEKIWLAESYDEWKVRGEYEHYPREQKLIGSKEELSYTVSKIKTEVLETTNILEYKKYRRAPFPRKGRKGEYILKDIKNIRIWLHSRNVPFGFNSTIVDTPGFDSEFNRDQNDSTINNLTKSSKIIVVSFIDFFEATALTELLEAINLRCRDIPKILIVNFNNRINQATLDARIKTAREMFLTLAVNIQKIYFINLQDVLTIEKMSLNYESEDDKVIFIQNGEFTNELWLELLTTPEEYFPDMIKRVLGKEYSKIQIDSVEEENKRVFEKLSMIYTAASLSDEKNINPESIDIICQTIQKYITVKTKKFIEDNIKDNSDEDRYVFKVQKKCWEETKGKIKEADFTKLEDDIRTLEKAAQETSRLVIENKLISEKDEISNLTHNYVERIKERLRNGNSMKEVAVNIRDDYLSEVREVLQKYFSIWASYGEAIQRLFLKYQINKIMKEQIESGPKYEEKQYAQ